MKRSKLYKLPSGKYTDDIEEFIKSWEEFCKPFCEATGSRIHSFDPGVAIILEDNTTVVDLPILLIEEFNKRIEYYHKPKLDRLLTIIPKRKE